MVKGNLIDLAEQGYFDVIVHGCNCFHTMGAGIAKEIVQRYPQALEADTQFSNYGDRNKLGDYTWTKMYCENGHRFFIVNAYTQYGYGRGKQVDENAIRRVFRLIRVNYPNCRIGYPKIGAGLAGGDWNIIQQIINEELLGVAHELVVL